MRPIRCLSRLIALSTLVVWHSACSAGDPAGPPPGPATTSGFAISDGAHSGNEKFFFLPPLVGNPGPFDGNPRRMARGRTA